MKDQELEFLRYPIGRFQIPDSYSKENINKWITVLEEFPIRLEALVKHLTSAQLDSPYRPGGWTVRQLVHHISDSHHHSYTRFKWALTEDTPLIKAYDEKLWADLVDAKTEPIQMSLEHLKAVQYKLVRLLKRLTDEELERAFIHPETNLEVPLKLNIALYAWHSEHHYAHIKNFLDRS